MRGRWRAQYMLKMQTICDTRTYLNYLVKMFARLNFNYKCESTGDLVVMFISRYTRRYSQIVKDKIVRKLVYLRA